MLPLAGIRVLEIDGLVAIPYAGHLLASLGAEVLRVEPPSGSALRRIGPFSRGYSTPESGALHLHLDRGKRAVTLDTGGETGREILAALVPRHDVVLHALDDASAEACGLLGCRHEASSTIAISLTPFGRTGPKARWRGYELNVQAMAGVNLGVGMPDRAPLPVPDFLTEFFVGAVVALAALLGLSGRERHGTGARVDLAAADVWATYQTGITLVNWLFDGQEVKREGRSRRGGPYPHTILPCKDGHVRLITSTKREWLRFVHVMGNPEWSTDERFQDRIAMNERHADELDGLVTQWLKQYTKRELFQKFYEGGVPFTPLNNFADVLADPQLEARSVWQEVAHPGAVALRVPRPPHGIRACDEAQMAPAPWLGEHNFEVYVRELGVVPADQFETLYQTGVV